MSGSISEVSQKVNSSPKVIRKREVRPYGLASLCDNWLKNSKQAYDLKYGYVTEDEIVKDFQDMLKRVDGKRTCLFVNKAGEVKTFPVRSRWNSEYNYGGAVGKKALDEVKGLRRVTHLILTIDQKKKEFHIPDWWVYGDKEYYAVMGGKMVSEFLRKYRSFRKKNDLKNNFVAWVMEFTGKELAHFHLLFYGAWTAPIDVLHKFWPYCEKNGIRFGKPQRHQYSGHALARYLTRYITKDLQSGDNKEVSKDLQRIKAFLWFFKRRLYNLRHNLKKENSFYTVGIGRVPYKSTEEWRLYKGNESEEVVIERGVIAAQPEKPVVPSDMFLRWKALPKEPDVIGAGYDFKPMPRMGRKRSA